MTKKPTLPKLPGWLRTFWKKSVRLFLFLRRLFPITWTGMALAGLGVATIFTQGIGHKDLVLLTGAMVVLSIQALLLGLTILATIFAAIKSRRARSTEVATELETDIAGSTGFAVRFPGWLPLVSLSWEWVSPAGVEVRMLKKKGRIEEEVIPGVRGLSGSIRRKFTLRDFLGLSSIQWMANDPVSLRILPHRILDNGLALPLGLGVGEDLSDPSGSLVGDQVEMREYQPGDSPRLIRWKLYARTKKLLIRTPERAIAEQPSTCAYLLGGSAAGPAAELARELLERGSFGGDFLFGAEGSSRVSNGDLDLARNIVAESGMQNELSCDGLTAFLGAASGQGFSDCLIFAPPEIASIAEKLAPVFSSSPIYVRAVLCVKELADEKPVRLWKKIVFRGDPRVTLTSLRTSFNTISGLCAPQIFEQRSAGFFAL